MRKIGVIGAGIMGSSLANCLLMSGFSVELADINSEALDAAVIQINDNLEDAVNKNIISSKKADKFLKQLKTRNSINDFSSELDFVIEAATENLDTKIEIFNELETICSVKTIFATNTSCLSVASIAVETSRADKFIGMHFFYPADRNKLVEIVPIDSTSEDTLQQALELAEYMDKISITVKDSPGFCINRFFVPTLNEATKFLEDPMYEDECYKINHAVKETFKAPFGPFEIMNLTGVDLAYKASSLLADAHGSFYKPSKILTEYAEDNKLWDLPEKTKYLEMESEFSKEAPKFIKHFQGIVMALTARLVEKGIASPTDINMGARVGLGWKKGPFNIMNELGPAKTVEYVNEVIKEYPNIKIPEILENTDHWEILSTSYSESNNIASITLRRPESLNALNENLLLEIDKHMDKALENEDIDLITLSGYPKVFSAGADLKSFINKLENQKVDQIFNYTKTAHKILNKIANSPKPVIALIDGIALGGGLELALTCDFLIATERSVFQFPETTIGLFPGFGGTQRTPKRAGVEGARYLILLGRQISSNQALELGLIDCVTEDKKQLIKTINKISQTRKITSENIAKKFKQTRDISPEILKDLQLFRNIDLLISRKLISKRAKAISAELEKKSMKAIHISNNLINMSSKIPVEEGMELEMKYVKEVFKQPDLLDNFKKILNQ